MEPLVHTLQELSGQDTRVYCCYEERFNRKQTTTTGKVFQGKGAFTPTPGRDRSLEPIKMAFVELCRGVHWGHISISCIVLFTACKRSLGQGNVFTLVCDSVHRVVYPIACWDPPPGQTPHPQADIPPGRPSISG